MNAHVVKFGPKSEDDRRADRQGLVDDLYHYVKSQDGLKYFPGNFRIAHDERIWETERVFHSGSIIPPCSYYDFIHKPYADGIGASYELVEKLIAGDRDTMLLHEQAKARKPGNPNRDPETGRLAPSVDNVNDRDERPTGNTAAAALRRLSKEAEAGNTIAAQALAAVKDGTKSPHRAMVECGYRKGIDPEIKSQAAHDAADWALHHAAGDYEQLEAFEHMLRRSGAKNIADQLANMLSSTVISGGQH